MSPSCVKVVQSGNKLILCLENVHHCVNYIYVCVCVCVYIYMCESVSLEESGHKRGDVTQITGISSH